MPNHPNGCVCHECLAAARPSPVNLELLVELLRSEFRELRELIHETRKQLMSQIDDLLAIANRTQQSVNAVAGTVTQVSTDIQTAIGLLQQNGGGDNPQITQAIQTLTAAADSLDAAATQLSGADTALQGAEGGGTPPGGGDGGGVQAASHASAQRPGSAASVA